jgi:uncharacterized alpha-E superfamily protein
MFWMGRYMERADATARLIEMGYRMAMLPGSNEMEEWRSVAAASGSAPDIAEAKRGSMPPTVVQRLLLDPDNPSSIRSCLTSARANGRAIRTALTQDMWEALNDGWRSLGQMDAETALKNLPSLLEWTKNRTAAFRGASEISLLRNDGYYFLRMGGLIERADMTLRLLDVKYYVLLARDRCGRRRSRLSPVDQRAARHVGAARLSPCLQRRLHAVGHRGFPHPQ